MSFHQRSSFNRFNPPAATTRFPPRFPPFRPIINTSRTVVKPRPPSPIKPAIKCSLPAAKSVATTRYHGDVHKNMPRIVYKPKSDSDEENDGETASKTKRCSESDELTAYAPLLKKSCPSVPVLMPKFSSVEELRKAFSSDTSLQPIQLHSIYPETIDEKGNGVAAKPVGACADEAYYNPEYARRKATDNLPSDFDAWKSYRGQSNQVSSGSDLDSNWNEEDIRNTSSPGFDKTTNSKCKQLCL